MPDRESPDLLSLTARLVAAYLRGNALPADELANIIPATHAALAAVLNPPHLTAPQQPAVSLKKSVRPNAIVCLECGSEQQMLKRHLRIKHGLSVEDYKAKWSLPGDYPMTAPNYAGHRSDLAKKFGLGKTRARGLTTEPEIGSAAAPQPEQKYPPSRWSRPAQ